MKESWVNWTFKEALPSVKQVKLELAEIDNKKRRRKFEPKDRGDSGILKIITKINMDDVETVNLQRNLENLPSVEIIFKS